MAVADILDNRISTRARKWQESQNYLKHDAVDKMKMIYPHKRLHSRWKLSQELKGNWLHSLQIVQVWKWPVAKYKHQNKAKNLYTIYFVFDLDGECKFIKTKHYSDSLLVCHLSVGLNKISRLLFIQPSWQLRRTYFFNHYNVFF